MKKILSVLFAIAMVFGCVGGMSVFAESGFSFTVSQANGFVGEEVEVTVSVNDNVGITGIIYTLAYDANVLELKSVKDAALLGGFTTSPALQANPFKCTYVQADNVSANGVVTTFVFEIKADAPAGKSAISLDLVQCTQDEANVYPAMIDGGVTVLEETATAITSSSVTLGQDIAINYFVELNSADLGAQMKFTMNNKETLVSAQYVSGNEYVYTFTGISPQCMGDNIKAELVKGGNVVASKDSFSVRDYCLALVAKTAGELGYTAEQYSAMKTLVADLMEYGAAAQNYKLHALDAMVNEGFTGATVFAPFANSDKVVEKTEDYTANMAATAAGVYFDYANSLYLKVNCKGFTASDSRIQVTDAYATETYTIADCELLDDGKYCLRVPVSPADFDEVYQFSMQIKSSGEWVASQNVDYSVNAYIYSIINGGKASAEMVDLAKALYNYGLSADAFLEA